MKSVVDGKYFCDLFCYYCESALLKGCPFFKNELSFRQAFIIYVGRGILFKEEDVLSNTLWKDKIVLTPKDFHSQMKFPKYEGEVCN